MAVDIEALKVEARRIPEDKLSWSVPLVILLGEAVDVARFYDRYWEAQREPGTRRVLRPGLELGAPKLRQELAEEILALQEATQEAKTAHLLQVNAGNDTMARAHFVLSEITATIEWMLDDEVEDDRDAQFETVKEEHEDPNSQDALASALDDFAALADTMRSDLEAISAFDVALIDQAKEIAKSLRELSAQSPEDDKAKQLLVFRNQLATLLSRRMTEARKGARYIFRHHPDLARSVGSAYERRRRAASRRAKAKAAAEAAAAAASAADAAV